MDHNESGTGQPAFLLAQLGAHAASQFAERLGVLGLTPADTGILRLLRVAAGLSQQELAPKLQIHPSRLVAREHKEALLSTLNREERDELAALLLKVADQQGLVRGVHPGYQRLGSAKRPEVNGMRSAGGPDGQRRAN